jgi:hypothetical protein
MKEMQTLMWEARSRGCKPSACDGRLILSEGGDPQVNEEFRAREPEAVSFLYRHAVLETIDGLDEQVWVIRPEIPRGAKSKTKRVLKSGEVRWGVPKKEVA